MVNGHVRTREMSESEQPMMRRERLTTMSKPRGTPFRRDKSRGSLVTDLDGIRRIGCMNLVQASYWNVGTCWWMLRETL